MERDAEASEASDGGGPGPAGGSREYREYPSERPCCDGEVTGSDQENNSNGVNVQTPRPGGSVHYNDGDFMDLITNEARRTAGRFACRAGDCGIHAIAHHGYQFTRIGGTVTHARILLDNGFSVSGESACVNRRTLQPADRRKDRLR